LRGPTARIHPERFGAAIIRHILKTALGDFQQSAGAFRLKRELDQSRRLGGIVDALLDCIRMPAIGKIALWLDALDGEVDVEVVAAAGFRECTY
jgi:hypothetical protein